MFDRSNPSHAVVARVVVWLALSLAFLAYIGWGTELTSVTSFFFIRRGVPEIWSFFRQGLPEVGNARLLGVLFWASIGTLIAGSLALFWLALASDATDIVKKESVERPTNDL